MASVFDDIETSEALYERMLLIRRFENKVRELVNANKISGVAHEYIGQEAIAVGVCAALRPDDVIASTHRGHGHIIAKGGDIRRMMAELFGRIDGYNKGRGGSMHIADLELGIYGANGIVGAGLPIVTGAAWALAKQGKNTVSVGFFGDGASNQGVVHETMNLAAAFRLPVVFVCENNQYGISTSIKHTTNIDRLSKRAAGYGFEGITVDGMDVSQVYSAAEWAVEKARSGGGPTLIECVTYRFVGHYTAEEALRLNYRSDEEIEAWKQRDPLILAEKALSERHAWGDARRAEILARVDELISGAVQFAEQSDWPLPTDAYMYAYTSTNEQLPERGHD